MGSFSMRGEYTRVGLTDIPAANVMQYIFNGGVFFRSLFIGQIVLVTINSQHQQACQNVSALANYMLEGHVFNTIYGKSFETCVTSCEDNKRCLSLNYMRFTRTCELNTRSKSTNPCDMRSRDSGVYMDSLRRFAKDACALNPCRNGGTCLVTSCCRGFQCLCGDNYRGDTCEDCRFLGVPLGMKSRIIPDVALAASSYYPGYPPSSGRVDDPKGWLSLPNDTSNPYFQVELQEKKTISRVCLQGIHMNITSNHNAGAWVKKLYFSYSLDGKKWTDYIQDRKKFFQGCTGVDDKKFYNFTIPIQARYFQIRPNEYENFPALRMELYGCDAV